MRSTTTYERGQVVVVNVPFPNQTGSKRRPALIVSTSAFHRTLPDLVICPVSSRPRYYRRPGPGDCRIAGWKHVGLRHPSVVRISNIVAVEKSLIGRALGRGRPIGSRSPNASDSPSACEPGEASQPEVQYRNLHRVIG